MLYLFEPFYVLFCNCVWVCAVVVDLPLLRVAVEWSDNPISLEKPCQAIQRSSMLFEVYRCVQLNMWYVGVFYIGDREGRCGVFRRLCVGMILGWDFFWFGVGRGNLLFETTACHSVTTPFWALSTRTPTKSRLSPYVVQTVQ